MGSARMRSVLLAVAFILFFHRAASAQLNPNSYGSIGTLNVLSGTLAINTDTLTMSNAASFTGAALAQAGGPEIAVFDFSSITIGSGITVTITGSRPLALLSKGGALINTTLPNFSGGGYDGGFLSLPSSITTASQPGQGPGAGGASGDLTGGGGYGGNGGGAIDTVGTPYGNLLQTLVGGSGGGVGITNNSSTAQLEGGSGGGAIEVVAVGNLTVSNISANAGGASSSVVTSVSSGVSGGSGGGILLSGGTGLAFESSVTLSAVGMPATVVGAGVAGGGGGGRINLAGMSTYTLGTAVSGVTVNLGGGTGGGTTTFGAAGVLTVDALSTTIPSGDSITLNGNAVTSIAGSFSQTGATISAFVHHSAVINSGATATLGANNALQLLDSSGNNITAVTVNGTWNLNGFNQTIDTLLGTSTSASLSIPSGSTLTVGIDNSVAGSGASSYSGQISGSGALIKVGTGSLSLAGANSFSGSTTVSNGTLTLANNAALQNSTVSISGGSLGFSSITAPVLGMLTGTSNLALNGITSLTVGGPGYSATYFGNLSGAVSGGLNKTGSGTWTLTGTNSQSGPLNVQGGTLLAGSSGAISTNAPITVSSGATLDLNGYNYTVTSANPINVQGSLRLGGASLNVASGGAAIYNGAFISNGSLQGSGTQTLTGGAALSGMTTSTSVTISQTGAASVSNFTNNGQFNNAAGQALSWTDGTVTSAGRMTVAGTVTASDFINNGIITISGGGALNNSGSNLILGGGSQTTVNASGNLSTTGATIELNGGLLINNGAITGTTDVNFGSLAKGTGTYGVVNVNQGGIYAPGNSPGIVTAAAVNFSNTPVNTGAAQLQIELAGTTLGTQYDQLHVTGQLSLGGILQVSLLNDFAPAAGELFNILDWGTLVGHFSSLSLPALSSGLTWNSLALYTTGTLAVVNSNFLPGDFNRDGHIDAADIQSMMQALVDPTDYEAAHDNLTNAQLQIIGDINGDGKFTNADVQSLLNALQAGQGSTATVPEPAAFVLGAVGLVIFLFAHRGSESV
ncbi:MAG TPA: autotransporter-associated beta strand repeat-containing protein [Pirellulales bacterium]|jgi:autotransporter-associated beta strand protein|nr:autotransporter-associated beta strand repeat-containing protein [Pirellulales bacterium]